MKTIFSAIRNYIKHTDLLLIFTALAASGMGLVLVYSATYSFTSNRLPVIQAVAVGLGLVLMLAISKLDYELLSELSKFLYVLNVLAMIFTVIFGFGPAGTDIRSWLPLGPVSVQPSELAKLAFVITFATHLNAVGEELNSIKNVFFLMLHAGSITGLILLQGDDGSAIVFLMITCGMLFAAGLKVRYFVAAGVAAVAAAPLVWTYYLRDYQRRRILLSLNPELDPLETGYQAIQGKIAIGSGQLMGKGFLQGSQVQYGILPAKETDYIFAVAGEEFGFIGCMAVLLVLLVLIARILFLSRKAKNDLGSYICVGVFSMLFCQVLINIGMTVGLVPVIGITLPLFSYGGSSVVSVYCALGLVLSVHMHRRVFSFSDDL